MRWSIARGVDGVITDDPERFGRVCEEWEGGGREVKVGWRVWAQVGWIWVLVGVFGAVFWWRYGRGGRGGKERGEREGEGMGIGMMGGGGEVVDGPREMGRVLGEEEGEGGEGYRD